MNVLLVVNARIPVTKYGGAERFVWWLGKELAARGHRVGFLAPPGSSSSFAAIHAYDFRSPLNRCLPSGYDIVHLNGPVNETPDLPHLHTYQWTAQAPGACHPYNTVYASRDLARRCGGEVYIHHGLDVDAYGKPDFRSPKRHLVFLAKAAWKVKNVRGAIRIAKVAGRRLAVAGGYRVNFNMGLRITVDRHVRFHGMVADRQKIEILNRSQALLFPVLWHEPFGIALIESMYFGNPVFGTPWGSLPEIVIPEVGFLSGSERELAERIRTLETDFDRRRCHEYVCDQFSSARMARDYLKVYERVLNGERLHALQPQAPQPAEVTYRLKMAA